MEDEAAAPAGAEPGEGALPEGAEADASPGEASPPKGEAEEGAAAGGGEESPGAEEGAAAEAAEGAGESPAAAAAGEEAEEPEGAAAAAAPSTVSAVGGEEEKREAEADAEGAAGQEAEEEEGPAAGDAAAAAAAEGPAEEGEEREALPPPSSSSRGSLLAGPLGSVSFVARGPPPVGEEVSRRLSASLRELEALSGHEVLEPGDSPDGGGSEEAEESQEALEARRAEEQRQRAELAEQYRQLVAERGRLRQQSAKLQGRLAVALSKAKGKERARAELEQHISNKEQRYSRYLAMLQELRSQQREETAWYQAQMDALQHTCEEKMAKVNSQWKAFQAAKKGVAVYTMGRRLGGKQAAIQQVDQIQCREESKEREMTEVHLENIKLKQRIAKLEASLKAQEELAEGLHLIDFEQLKIENQTYNEKIEERNEELLKLRGKVTNTVHVLAHVKEKLQFVEAENQGQKAQLMAGEAQVAQKRDILTKTKQARDRLRMDNLRLHQECGLLGDKILLRDFEDKVNAKEVLKERLEALKLQHAGLALTCNRVKKKIRGIKSFLPI